MTIVDIKPECAECPRMALPKKALLKADELSEYVEVLREQALEADNTIEYHTPDDRFVTAYQLLNEQADTISSGADSLRLMARSAIAECQDGCGGFVADRFVCQGNNSEWLQALEIDYGEGGLE
ncbi:MAG: hypothetical protein H6793_01395 [Candidatus Nomurabacteria bacterium]|nr:hypothetical protein [Candidatus Saccharibacteria bacterium]USN95799.1 MAG: hypothetical protein H6793_01395 [Candidatus Nomurabacteria bacterium]